MLHNRLLENMKKNKLLESEYLGEMLKDDSKLKRLCDDLDLAPKDEGFDDDAFLKADLLEVDELPECDIYLHEWLTSEFWNEKRFLSNWFEEKDKEMQVGHILDLVRYATWNGFIDKLYPNTVELSNIDGESHSVGFVDIHIDSYSKYSKQFIKDYYSDIEQATHYENTIFKKDVLWKGHIKDLKHQEVDNFLGWELSFDDKHVLSNHLPISHWGLKHGSS